ncbi:NmrA family transcriptional regulator [Basidiobolus meristosporus CBS 931.73]|uniref:NmrA family transcriptional regulator n=1 Tax=Basidiobolus meristosporus CBS 931.73 TaxID=1314790 RepID=A0A1Y1XUI1_9FUNG|nr:NmrA family transcriptional regulator [Basidiobolus meristosporus CBS 931.73]|eukprot:ORX89427.1 NmrA family transcriptional regulator [Basidiobolus meristosporus CBS 931.73]
MPQKILVVFGATGQQGGSVVDYVLNDPDLSRQFKVRAITRDASKPAAQALVSKGAQVVEADVDDSAAVQNALQGAHTVFSVTLTVYDDKLRDRELTQGKWIGDAAVQAGAQYLIYSTLPHATALTHGKYKYLGHFDVKYDIEQYIRTLPIKSAFFAPGSFMQNYVTAMAPRPVGDGSYALSSIASKDSLVPLIEIASDTGKYVGAILAEPDKYEGKVFSASTKLYTYEQIADALSHATGKQVNYQQLPKETFKGFLPPIFKDYFVDMLSYIEEFGYYGPQTEEQVKWAAEHARGKVLTFEEFLAKNPLQLQ